MQNHLDRQGWDLLMEQQTCLTHSLLQHQHLPIKHKCTVMWERSRLLHPPQQTSRFGPLGWQHHDKCLISDASLCRDQWKLSPGEMQHSWGMAVQKLVAPYLVELIMLLSFPYPSGQAYVEVDSEASDKAMCQTQSCSTSCVITLSCAGGRI